MHIDARTLDESTLIEGDLCIIGAGAAGISLALEWLGSSKTVILLEGGGFNLEAKMQALYEGKILDRPYYSLETVRLHYFGGTTGHWAGFCSPFDPIDFEQRDWVPYSGWPITRVQLDPYYERAQRNLELRPFKYDAADWEEPDQGKMRLPLDARTFYPKIWQFSPPTRMGTVYRDQILNAPNVNLYTYANVVEIVSNEEVTAVERLRAKTLDGREIQIRAGHYVAACNSIQNARLLLASNGYASQGLGNDYDTVGRFFMDHYEIFGAQVKFEKPQPLGLYLLPRGAGPRQPRAEIALHGEKQRQYQLLNSTASFTRPYTNNPKNIEWNMAFPSMGANPKPQTVYRLFTRQEQAPNRSSRIVLSTDRDQMGMLRADLRLNFSPLDKRSVRVFYELLGKELGRAGLGRLQMLDWLLDGYDHTWPEHLRGGWHNMGTARMHDNPRQGVVDRNCKVHGLANLYVAGAAVFPTGGAANPTLTLVALALRLSDHLKSVMG